MGSGGISHANIVSKHNTRAEVSTGFPPTPAAIKAYRDKRNKIKCQGAAVHAAAIAKYNQGKVGEKCLSH